MDVDVPSPSVFHVIFSLLIRFPLSSMKPALVVSRWFPSPSHSPEQDAPNAFKSSLACWPRFVQMLPGCTLNARRPLALYLFASAFA